MKWALIFFLSFFLFTTLYYKLHYNIREIFFIEYFYLLTAGILLLFSIYFAIKNIIQRLKAPPQPSHLETLLRAIGFATGFTLWALYIEIEGIQLITDSLFWFFTYFFLEILYLKSRFPSQFTQKPHWFVVFLSNKPVRLIFTSFLFYHILNVNWQWWEWQLKGFIGLFILKDPIAWY